VHSVQTSFGQLWPGFPVVLFSVSTPTSETSDRPDEDSQCRDQLIETRLERDWERLMERLTWSDCVVLWRAMPPGHAPIYERFKREAGLHCYGTTVRPALQCRRARPDQYPSVTVRRAAACGDYNGSWRGRLSVRTQAAGPRAHVDLTTLILH